MINMELKDKRSSKSMTIETKENQLNKEQLETSTIENVSKLLGAGTKI